MARITAPLTPGGDALTVALAPGEDPDCHSLCAYDAQGEALFDVTLGHPLVTVGYDKAAGSYLYTLRDGAVSFRMTDPSGAEVYSAAAFALVDTSAMPPRVLEFLDLGTGSRVRAREGPARGEISRAPVLPKPVPEALTPDPRGEVTGLATGTLLRVPGGVRAVETLRPGDFVLTRDGGPQALRWVGSSRVGAEGPLAPVLIRAGAHGAERDLLLSPRHRILCGGWRAERLFQVGQVLVPVLHLVDGEQVQRRPGGRITYHRLLFDRHQVVTADGVAVESFLPDAAGLSALPADQRAEVEALLPGLASDGYGPPAHRALGRDEAGLMRG